MYTRFLLLALCAASAFPAGFQSSDLLKLRSVGAVQFSPDGSRIAYTITRNDGPRRPVAQLWIMTLADRKIHLPQRRRRAIGQSGMVAGREMDRLLGPAGRQVRAHRGAPGWKRQEIPRATRRHQRAAAHHRQEHRVVARQQARSPMFRRSPVRRRRTRPAIRSSSRAISTNPRPAKEIRISTTTSACTFSSSTSRPAQSRQLTNGTHYEHSIDWSPDGKQIAFISNREPNEDQFFNYDLFTLDRGHRRNDAG